MHSLEVQFYISIRIILIICILLFGPYKIMAISEKTYGSDDRLCIPSQIKQTPDVLGIVGTAI